jgi:two-component system response regulator FlrC
LADPEKVRRNFFGRTHLADKLRLLIVDDDADLLDPLVEVCERFDFDVIGATSGQSAIDMIQRYKVDAVLTDVRMQPMGGFALLEKIRAARPEIPFILWTGFWDRPDEKRAATYQNIEKLEKPFTFKELENVLNRVRAKVMAARESGSTSRSRFAQSPSAQKNS